MDRAVIADMSEMTADGVSARKVKRVAQARAGAGAFWVSTPSTPSPYDGQKSFLPPLRARGVDGVISVTSDAHEGLKRAIREVFPGATWRAASCT